MMELRDHYDWVAVGQFPGALLSAALAARQGLSVLVLPGPDESGLIATSPTELLDPELSFLPNKPFFDRVIKSLWGTPPEWLSADRRDVPQLVTPEGRFHVTDAARWTSEGISTALKKLEFEAEKFWSSAPSRPSSEGKRTDVSYLDQWSMLSKDLCMRLGRDLRSQAPEWVGGWLAACGASLDPLEPNALALLGMTQNGYWVRGGMPRLRKELLSLIEESGGHVSRGSECTQIFVERSTLSGVQVSDKGRTIGARAVVVGESLQKIRSKTYFASGQQFSKRLKESRTVSDDRFFLAVSVHKEALPPGLGSFTVWSEDGAPPLLIQHLRPEDYGLGEGESTTLGLSLRRTNAVRTAVSDEALGARMIRKLSDLVPFLDFHIVKTLQAPPQTPLPSLESAGFGSGVDRLYLASPESYPKLGTFGPFLAGLESVEHFLGRTIA